MFNNFASKAVSGPVIYMTGDGGLLSPKLEKSSSSHQSIYYDQFDAKKLPQLWLDNVVKRFIASLYPTLLNSMPR